jgi:hypothetical protein
LIKAIFKLENKFEKAFTVDYVCSIGFYFTPTQNRSYRDVPASLVEEDLRCPSVNYFRLEQAPE